MNEGRKITVGELLDSLSRESRDTEVIFQGGLNFYRLKQRGEDLIQVEFNEPVSDAMNYYFKHHK
ncbi:hypothetical protein [Pseudomonas fluorescens]|jgi:hypothetical protein|uniref:Uncharacterized protein n=1 Tax=Pseudomonas fluorescens TaxID=294 RepID=A0A5E6QIK9_PSEFL|nr:hypothetical protein [Pseudomonas fluorescens]VVM55168.1 hypothetical protein PS655_00998 [Pseudomonas fluorescens]